MKGQRKALLEKGKSLLPGGILAVEGDFQQGDPVEVLNKGRILIGKGLSNYSAREIELIRGHHSRKISSILGYSNGPSVSYTGITWPSAGIMAVDRFLKYIAAY